MTNVGAFLVLYKYLRKEEPGLKGEEIEAAMADMLKRAKIVDFNEYIRSYKYKRREMSIYHKQLLLESRDFRSVGPVFRSSRELLGHSGQIERLCFDQSSRFFVSGSSDGMVKLWDMHTGFLIHSFIGHRSLVNDLCISSDGALLVSCDFFGLLNLWSLKSFSILFQLRLECEIMFAEFFDVADTSGYNLVVVLAKGVVKIYRFNEEGIFDELENLCLLDEAIKGLCFTEGGRFLLCSGWWPFLVMFDTQKSDGCIVLETNGIPVNTICGAKHGLKVAAACGSQIYQWTFFTEGNPGMGNFKRRTKDISLEGHWKRSVIRLEMDENECIERICYLKDNFVVCVCTDLRIRIFAGVELRCTIDSQEMGIVYPHPTENIFAFCGSHLRIYDMDVLIYEEALNFSVNDAQFSNDGNFFMLGDERGVVKVLSMDFLPKPPREQFFVSDFDHINSLSDGHFVECRNDATFNINRERNKEWKKIEYIAAASCNVCLRIEDLGAKHFYKDFVHLDVFRRKYMNSPLQEEVKVVETQISSSSESATDHNVDSSSTLLEESSTTCDEECEEFVYERISPLRRFLLESDDGMEERGCLNEENEDGSNRLSPLDGCGTKRLRCFDGLEDAEMNTRDAGERGYVSRSSSISNLILRNMELMGNSRSVEMSEESRFGGRNFSPSSQALVHNESELTQYVQSWLSSRSLVQLGDVVYFDEEALRDFQKFDTRRKFKGITPSSGYYEVENLEIVKYDPPFLKVTLNQQGLSSVIRYYRHPQSSPVLLLKEQLEISPRDNVIFVMDDSIMHGRVSGVQQHDFTVLAGDSHVHVAKSDVLIPKELFSEDTKYGILGLLKQKKTYRNLYTTLRRESNTRYYENIASNINLSVIEEKILHDLYRTVEALEFDLDIAVNNSFYLGSVFYEYCKQLVENIKSVIESGS